MASFRIIEAGDAALVVEMGSGISAALNQKAVALADALAHERVPGVRDIVPTFASVTVYFDPLTTNVEALSGRLAVLAELSRAATVDEPTAIRDIPVCYGGDLGPDLPEVGRRANVAEADVIERHSARVYRVFMLGFLPGFAYLGIVDPAIAIPRRREPRARVPAGSVAIAGELTGIYPSDSPGGWHVIGRTPVRPFVHDRTPPSLFRPGDVVRFRPITRDAFEQRDASEGPAR